MRVQKFLVLAVLVCIALGLASPAMPVYAATTIVVTPSIPNGWFFHDDGVAGVGVGNLVSGPATPPMGGGSVHFVLDATAREAIATVQFAGTRFDKITNLQYSTYRSSFDAGNNLAVALQFDVDYDLTDTNTAWQGRLVFEPYMTVGGTVTQNTWQTWTPLTGKWWASGAPGNTLCPQSSPCPWAQVLSNWPNAGIRKNVGLVHLKAGGPAPGFEGNADALTIGVNGTDTTFDFEDGQTGLNFTPSASQVAVGNTVTVNIDLNSVTNLYGYQFQVNFDATKVSATSATFVNSFFTTASPASIPTGWSASCSGNSCKFAVSHVAPQTARTGSGTLAQIVFTGVAPGVANLTFSNDTLGDKNGTALAHNAGTGTITVYGMATITGTVALQGRTTPITAGTVTLTDVSATFAPTTTTFDATTGMFTAIVPSLMGGTNYTVLASHSLYLGSQKTNVVVTPNDTPNIGNTQLLGGDAVYDGVIDISDLGCIGGAFGGAPTTCGGLGGSDINADNIVNILDLVLAGGNYGLNSPQPW
jgi:hypothetical protein